MTTKLRDRDWKTGRVRFAMAILGMVLGASGGIAWSGSVGERLDTLAEAVEKLEAVVATKAEVQAVAKDLAAHVSVLDEHEKGGPKVERIVEWHDRLNGPLIKELAAIDARNAAAHADIVTELRALRSRLED